MKKLLLFIFVGLLSVNGYSQIDMKLPENLSLQGDVRSKWKSEFAEMEIHEFKVEMTVGCEYTLPEAWAAVKIKASTANEKDSVISLEKAMIGNRLYQGVNKSFTIELGRDKSENLYDSKLQYKNYFNGIHLVYNYVNEGLVTLKLHGGPHIANTGSNCYGSHTAHTRDNRYGMIVEGVCSELIGMPLTVKYSFTDWNVSRMPKRFQRHWHEDGLYSISQVLSSYQVGIINVYAAYLINHQVSKSNDGFYTGFTVGKINQRGDWSVDVNIQHCKLMAVPLDDFKGGMKKGLKITTIYALSNNLNLEGKLSLYDSHTGSVNNTKAEISAIYTW